MADKLVYNLQDILEDRNTNLLPENLKAGITCLGVEGTMEPGIDTSDATATADDIVVNKTAYVNGEKIEGTIPQSNTEDQGLFMIDTNTENWNNAGGGVGFKDIRMKQNRPKMFYKVGDLARIRLEYEPIAELFGVTPEKIVEGNTILDVEGTAKTGTDTSDADAIASNILQGKTAYVNGEKLTGTMYKYPNGFEVSANHERTSVEIGTDPVGQTPSLNISIIESTFVDTIAMDKYYGNNIYVSYENIVNAIGLTPDKIKAGETILGITGTYIGETTE